MNKKNNAQEQVIDEAKQIALEQLASDNCLIRVVAGSHAYGTNIATSDWDERAIFVADMASIVLPFEKDKIEQVKFREDDKVYFELSKFMPLLLAQNPNVIELLWTDSSDILEKNALGDLLIENRGAFLSKQVKDSYVGYAMSQLNRIKGHNKWINNPQPEREPQQQDFMSVVWNYSGNKALNKSVPVEGYVAVSLGNHTFSLWKSSKLGLPEDKSWMDHRGVPTPIDNLEFNKMNSEHLPPDLIAKVNFNLYDDHHTNWKAYWNWKRNRNETRSALEEKYGYDVKHAMHLIRLLRSGIDILEKGVVPVRRDDAAYLLDIRNGHYTYEEIIKESELLSKKVQQLSEKTTLPEQPDYNLAKAIMMEIYTNQWGVTAKEVLDGSLKQSFKNK